MKNTRLYSTALLLVSMIFSMMLQAKNVSATNDKTNILSAGALEFSPDGILFVGDWVAGSVFAFDLTNTDNNKLPVMMTVDSADIDNIDVMISQLVGVRPGQITINDIAVHPKTQETFFSVTRGQGLDTKPAIIKLNHQGKLTNIRLDQLKYTRQVLNNAPDGKKQFQVRGFFGPPTVKHQLKAERSMKTMTFMDMEYYKGELFVAGISNEEFSSTLRRIPYPFKGQYSTSNIEIYHVITDSFVTRSPIRSLIVTEFDGVDYMIAGYSCTPIVVIPLEELKNGAHVKGRTVAELGPGEPLDMFIQNIGGIESVVISDLAHAPKIISVEQLISAKGLTQQDFGKGFNVRYREGPQGASYPMFGTPLHMDSMKVQTMLKGTPMETRDLYVGVTRDPFTGSLNYQRYFPFLGLKVAMAYGEPDFPGATH